MFTEHLIYNWWSDRWFACLSDLVLRSPKLTLYVNVFYGIEYWDTRTVISMAHVKDLIHSDSHMQLTKPSQNPEILVMKNSDRYFFLNQELYIILSPFLRWGNFTCKSKGLYQTRSASPTAGLLRTEVLWAEQKPIGRMLDTGLCQVPCWGPTMFLQILRGNRPKYYKYIARRNNQHFSSNGISVTHDLITSIGIVLVEMTATTVRRRDVLWP